MTAENKSIASWEHWENARSQAGQFTGRRTNWESGRPDYQGEDRFDNILTYMSAMMLNTQPSDVNQTSSTTTPKNGSTKPAVADGKTDESPK